MDPVERFMAKVEPLDDGCWEWTGAVMTTGYGQFRSGGQGSRVVKAHRWSYEHHVGAIPAGHQLHHRCGRRTCVRPDHLEAVTPAAHAVHHYPPEERKQKPERTRPVLVRLPWPVAKPYVEEARRRGVSVTAVVCEALRPEG